MSRPFLADSQLHPSTVEISGIKYDVYTMFHIQLKLFPLLGIKGPDKWIERIREGAVGLSGWLSDEELMLSKCSYDLKKINRLNSFVMKVIVY